VKESIFVTAPLGGCNTPVYQKFILLARKGMSGINLPKHCRITYAMILHQGKYETENDY